MQLNPLKALVSNIMSPVLSKLKSSESWLPNELEREIVFWTIALPGLKISSYLLISKRVHYW